MGLTSAQVVEFFNMACRTAGIAIMPGEPVVDSWISPEAKYGFIEFRSIDECTAAMALTGISLQGRQLVIKRPNDYEDAPAHIPTGVALVQAAANTTSAGALPGMMGGAAEPAATAAPTSTASTVLVLTNMCTVEELKNDEDFEDIMIDTKEECEKFGTVVSVKIPRPASDGAAVPGLGKVFVLFDSLESSIKAQGALHGRLFDNRSVDASYLTETKFLTGDLGD